jgi:hypothetical protein
MLNPSEKVSERPVEKERGQLCCYLWQSLIKI